MKKNVLIVPGFFSDTYCEIEKSYIELSNEAKEDIQFIWMVSTIDNKYNKFKNFENKTLLKQPLFVDYLDEYKIPYVTGNVSKYNFLHNTVLFYRVFKKCRIDAVYTHFGFERFYATFFGKILGKITIWNEHWISLGTKFTSIKKLFYILFIDYFISISTFVTSSLPKTGKVFTIKNSISVGEKEKVDENSVRELKRQLHIDESKIVILMVAAFTPEKRHDLAFEILSKVLKNRKDVIFVFLGDGFLRTEFLKKINDAGFSDVVLCPGHVNHVNDFYRVSDIFMLTSMTEGFGYVVLEAFKHSLPVVTFNSGGPSEIIKDGISGYLVKPEDTEEFTRKLISLTDNHQQRCSFGENGYTDVLHEYSRDYWIKNMINTFKSIL